MLSVCTRLSPKGIASAFGKRLRYYSAIPEPYRTRAEDPVPPRVPPKLFTLPPLPYAKKALSPVISEETVEYHYEKHHRGYVTRLNTIAQGTAWQNSTLEDIIKKEVVGAPIYNMGAQIWNHTFYWNSMSTEGGGVPKGPLAKKIDKSFGSFDNFKREFSTQATGHFGSGWAWLVQDKSGNLKITTGHDAQNPMREGFTPLLTCDVWEHAYYIDFRNDRAKYVEKWWDIVNWTFATLNSEEQNM